MHLSCPSTLTGNSRKVKYASWKYMLRCVKRAVRGVRALSPSCSRSLTGHRHVQLTLSCEHATSPPLYLRDVLRWSCHVKRLQLQGSRTFCSNLLLVFPMEQLCSCSSQSRETYLQVRCCTHVRYPVGVTWRTGRGTAVSRNPLAWARRHATNYLLH